VASGIVEIDASADVAPRAAPIAGPAKPLSVPEFRSALFLARSPKSTRSRIHIDVQESPVERPPANSERSAQLQSPNGTRSRPELTLELEE
jgi:hypothetical protein